MVVRCRCYKMQHLEETVEGGELHSCGADLVHTLCKKSNELQTMGALIQKCQGPKPALSTDKDMDIVAWIADMQRAGIAVRSAMVLERANKVYNKLHVVREYRSGCSASVSMRQYAQFIRHHPVLVPQRRSRT